MTTPTTNIEAWQLVHEGIAAGLTRNQIAARYDLSLQMVHHWSRMRTPPRGRKLGGPQVGPKARQPIRLCVDCKVAAVHSPKHSRGATGMRCRACDQRNQRAVKYGTDAKCRALLKWAETHGRVPTVTEARAIIGGARSCAGDRVLETFGRDTLDPARRRGAGPRPWPPA